MVGPIYSNQSTLFGHKDIIGFGDDSFYLKEIDRDLANDLIIKNHYSKKYYSASYIHLGIYSFNELKGVMQYGYAMNPASQKSVVSDTEINEYLELNRLWICDSMPRNTESKSISYSIKYIKIKYKKIKWIQSFADERCNCFGVVYQASNFSYYGEHTSVFWELENQWFHNTLMTAKNGKQGKIGNYLQDNKDKAVPHELRQFRYIYFIDKRFKNKCLLKECKYPKHGVINE